MKAFLTMYKPRNQSDSALGDSVMLIPRHLLEDIWLHITYPANRHLAIILVWWVLLQGLFKSCCISRHAVSLCITPLIRTSCHSRKVGLLRVRAHSIYQVQINPIVLSNDNICSTFRSNQLCCIFLLSHSHIGSSLASISHRTGWIKFPGCSRPPSVETFREHGGYAPNGLAH